MNANVKPKNVQRGLTFDRYLYAVLEAEADKLGIKVSHIVNQELSKRYEEKIKLIKFEEQAKYSSEGRGGGRKR